MVKIIAVALSVFMLAGCVSEMKQQSAYLANGKPVLTNLFSQEGTFGNNKDCVADHVDAQVVTFRGCFTSTGETQGAIAAVTGGINALGNVGYAIGTNRQAGAMYEQDKILGKTGINDVIGSVNTINVTSTATAGTK